MPSYVGNQSIQFAAGGSTNPASLPAVQGNGASKANSPRAQNESTEKGKPKKTEAKKRKRVVKTPAKKQQKTAKTNATETSKASKKTPVVKRILDAYEQVVLAKKPEQYDDEDEEYLRMRREELRSEREVMLHGTTKAKDGDRPHRTAAGT